MQKNKIRKNQQPVEKRWVEMKKNKIRKNQQPVEKRWKKIVSLLVEQGFAFVANPSASSEKEEVEIEPAFVESISDASFHQLVVHKKGSAFIAAVTENDISYKKSLSGQKIRYLQLIVMHAIDTRKLISHLISEREKQGKSFFDEEETEVPGFNAPLYFSKEGAAKALGKDWRILSWSSVSSGNSIVFTRFFEINTESSVPPEIANDIAHMYQQVEKITSKNFPKGKDCVDAEELVPVGFLKYSSELTNLYWSQWDEYCRKARLFG